MSMYQFKQCALTRTPRPPRPHCGHTHVPSSSIPSPHPSHVQHRPLFRCGDSTFNLHRALGWPLSQPAAHPLASAHASAAAPAALLDPLRPRAPNGQRVARHTALSAFLRQPTPVCVSPRGCLERCGAPWQSTHAALGESVSSYSNNYIFFRFLMPHLTPIFTRNRTPPRERAEVCGWGLGVNSHTRYPTQTLTLTPRHTRWRCLPI